MSWYCSCRSDRFAFSTERGTSSGFRYPRHCSAATAVARVIEHEPEIKVRQHSTATPDALQRGTVIMILMAPQNQDALSTTLRSVCPAAKARQLSTII